MKILSIDPSTKATGWAIFDEEKLIKYGVFKKDDDNESGRFYRHKRINYMAEHLEQIAIQYNVEKIISEAPPPTQNNSDTVLALGNLQGAILYMAHKQNIPLEFIEVSTWHGALGITKSKGDLKGQSINIANKQYNINLIYKSPKSKYNESDQADAICIGIYYLTKKINKNFKIISRR